MDRPLLSLALALTVAPGVPSSLRADEAEFPKPHLSAADSNARLRAAWVFHRLEGELDKARNIYHQLTTNPSVTVDVRARAALGLGLIERESGLEAKAAQWFKSIERLPGVASLWRGNARRLLSTIEGARSEGHLLSDLNGRVQSLVHELGEITDLLKEREDELQQKSDLLRRLRERDRERTVAEERFQELTRTKASRFADSLVNQDRELQSIKRYFVSQALYRGRTHFSQGRYLQAFNELKNVLDVEPNHREARELEARCRQRFALATRRPGLPAPARDAFRVQRGRERGVELMSAFLKKGRRCYGQGDTPRAIENLQRVLEEYAWSPVALSDDEVETIVQPAERLLRRCLEESPSREEALKLLGQESRLLEELKLSTDHLLDQEKALAETHGNMERLRNGEGGIQAAREECRRSIVLGHQALKKGDRKAAMRAFTDALTLLDWFPQLDSDGRVRRHLDRKLEDLVDQKSTMAAKTKEAS